MTNNAPQEARGAILVSPGSANLYDNGLPSMTVVKDDLSEADYQRYDTANKTLDSILVTNLFTYYVEAARSLITQWQEASNMFAAALPITGLTDEVAKTATRLRGGVLNAVSMLCYHQERTLDEVCDKYGHNSEQHVQVKRIFNALYDNYFGYRYLYKLRNIMVHDTMEAVSMTSKAYRNNGEPFANVDLDIYRPTFLASPKVGATLKAELASKPGDPSVLQMMMEIGRPLVKANSKLLTILHPDLTSVCDAVVDFDNLYEGKEGTKGLIHQLSPQLKAPFITGFTPWSESVLRFAHYYTTAEWNGNDDDEE